jgi:hypothetical protein
MALELREHLDRPRGKPSIIYLFGPFLVGNFVSIVESLEKFTHYDYGSHVVTTDRHIEFFLGQKCRQFLAEFHLLKNIKCVLPVFLWNLFIWNLLLLFFFLSFDYSWPF